MAMLKKSLSVVDKHESFYTGGQIQISKDGCHMFCPCDWKIQVLELSTGKVVKSFGQEEEPISCFCVSPDDKYVIAATRLLVLRQWDWRNDVITRSWRAIHMAPVSCLTFDPTSTLLASGSSDSTIKVWDIIEQYCTHNFKGHQGVVSIAKFRPHSSPLHLVTSADDYKMRVWDLVSSCCVKVVDGHYSMVTSLTFSPDGKTMYSGGRDSVIGVWDMEKITMEKTIPVFETVESVMLLEKNRKYTEFALPSATAPHVMVAGGQGNLRIFSIKTGCCIHTRSVTSVPVSMEEGEQIITQAFHHDALNSFVVVTYDHNITFNSDTTLAVKKQLSGSSSEILDLQFIGEEDTHIVVISNSEKITVFDVNTWSCIIVDGHTDMILAVDVYTKLGLVVTSSKDCTIKVWKFQQETGGLECVAVASGHVQPVGAVAFSRKMPTFLVSGSRDMTLKVWTLPTTLDTSEVSQLTCHATELAHDKDINSVVVSPNDKLIATASQDKTAKLWKASDLTLMGVFRGHSRGVWCVQFSPVDQCLATSSTDGTVKIWSLSDLSCVKTFEGHDASVLKVIFISRGMQLLSVGSDGLLKLWTIKTNECVKTFDEHEAKVWCVACSQDGGRVVTGDAESTVILWKDVSEQEEEESLLQQEQLMLQQQELSNLVQEKRYLKAIGLAITLEQPFRLLGILKEIMFESEEKTKLEETLAKLRPDQIDAVLRFSQRWNTNSKHCYVTQTVLRVLLQTYHPKDIVKLPNIKASIEGLVPYTERHFQRLSRLYQQARFVEYTWQCMRTVAAEDSSSATQDEGSKSDATSHEECDAWTISKNPGTRDSESECSSDSENETGPTSVETKLNSVDDGETDMDTAHSSQTNNKKSRKKSQVKQKRKASEVIETIKGKKKPSEVIKTDVKKTHGTATSQMKSGTKRSRKRKLKQQG